MEEKKKQNCISESASFFFFNKQAHKIHIFSFQSVKPLQIKQNGGRDTILLKLLLQLLLLLLFYLINENQPGSCLGRMFDVNPKESAEGQATCPVTNRTDENPQQ